MNKIKYMNIILTAILFMLILFSYGKLTDTAA